MIYYDFRCEVSLTSIWDDFIRGSRRERRLKTGDVSENIDAVRKCFIRDPLCENEVTLYLTKTQNAL